MARREPSEYQKIMVGNQKAQTGIALGSFAMQVGQSIRQDRHHQELLAAISAQNAQIEATAQVEARRAAERHRAHLEQMQQQARAEDNFRWSQWVQTDHGQQYLNWEERAEKFLAFAHARESFSSTIVDALWAERDKKAPAGPPDRERAEVAELEKKAKASSTESAGPTSPGSARKTLFWAALTATILGLVAVWSWGHGNIGDSYSGYNLFGALWWILAIILGIASALSALFCLLWIPDAFRSKRSFEAKVEAWRAECQEARAFAQERRHALDTKVQARKNYDLESRSLIGYDRGQRLTWSAEASRQRAVQDVMSGARQTFPSPSALPDVDTIHFATDLAGAVGSFMDKMQAESYRDIFGAYPDAEVLSALNMTIVQDAQGEIEA